MRETAETSLDELETSPSAGRQVRHHPLDVAKDGVDVGEDPPVEPLEDVTATGTRDEEVAVDVATGERLRPDRGSIEAEGVDGRPELVRCVGSVHGPMVAPSTMAPDRSSGPLPDCPPSA